MKRIQFFMIAPVLLLLATMSQAQVDENKADMADAMRSNGRIYVVVAVVVVILLGLILYLVRLDKKITRMEKDHKS